MKLDYCNLLKTNFRQKLQNINVHPTVSSEPAWNCIQFHLIRFTVEEWNIIHQDLIRTDQNTEVSTVRDSIKYEHKYNSEFYNFITLL